MEMGLLENDFNVAYLLKRVHNCKFAAVHCPLLCLTLRLPLQHGSVQFETVTCSVYRIIVRL